MRRKRLLPYIVTILILTMLFANRRAYGPGGRFPTWELSFKGTASGGSLILAETENRYVAYVPMETFAGESGESVAQRLADTINAHHSRQTDRLEYDPHWLWDGGFKARSSGPVITLPLFPSAYILAGTETGLGIPKPPLSLSFSYDKENDEIKLQWINPPDEYDLIWIKTHWTYLQHRFARRISNTSTNFIIDRKKIPVDMNDMDIRVVGFHDNIPSNAAAIHVSCGGYCQEETYGIPFTSGVAPNWTAWSTAAKPHTAAFEEGVQLDYARFGSPSTVLLTKPFYQVIKAPPAGVVHGVYRKFLGLTAGHTYRLTACLSTLEMDSVKGDWSLSLCATHNGPNGKDLTAQQLAGEAALPDGKIGLQAGQIASYSQGNTTKGDFALVFSGDNSHITLPAGVDTITVWVRFSCSDPMGKVGFSGVKLEDITAMTDVKSPEQVIREEKRAEARLIRWIEQASRR